MRSIEELRSIWERLRRPQCADDYGLSITLSEMLNLPEALKELEENGCTIEALKGAAENDPAFDIYVDEQGNMLQ